VCNVCQPALWLAGPISARVAHVQLSMRQVVCALAAEEQRICCKRANEVAGLVQQNCSCILLSQAPLQILGVCSTCLLRARCHLRQHLCNQIAWTTQGNASLASSEPKAWCLSGAAHGTVRRWTRLFASAPVAAVGQVLGKRPLALGQTGVARRHHASNNSPRRV